MKIGVSLLNFRPGVMGGIETYYRQIIKWLPIIAGDTHDVIFFSDRDIAQAFPEIRTISLGWSARRVVGMRLAEAFSPYRCLRLQKRMLEEKVDVMFFPHQAMFPLHCPVKSVVTVHDLQQVYFPHYFSLFDRLFRRLVWTPSLKICDRIISISNATKVDLVKYAQVSSEKIDVVHHGFDAADRSSVAPFNAGYPYLYYPAASFPHKGHRTLVTSFSALKKRGLLPGVKLILTGRQTPHWKSVEGVIKDEGLSGDVIHRGFVSAREVWALYKGAEAVLFPSEFEGFGIPVLEAAQCGKKFICSKLPVFQEIGVRPCWQIDFSDPDSLRLALDSSDETGLTKPALSWEKAIANTLKVIVGDA